MDNRLRREVMRSGRRGCGAEVRVVEGLRGADASSRVEGEELAEGWVFVCVCTGMIGTGTGTGTGTSTHYRYHDS